MHRIVREILVLLGLLVLVSPVAAESELTGFQPRHLQALLGVMVADEDNYQGFDSSGEPLETDEVFGTFAMAGGMVQLADGPSIFEYGIETGAFFGWKDIDTDYAGSSNSSGNSNIIVKVSSNFYMFEVLLGGFMDYILSFNSNFISTLTLFDTLGVVGLRWHLSLFLTLFGLLFLVSTELDNLF